MILSASSAGSGVIFFGGKNLNQQNSKVLEKPTAWISGVNPLDSAVQYFTSFCNNYGYNTSKV